MAKRFTSTELWAEDWFLDMPMEYKLYWYNVLNACDHAGLYRVNVRTFNALNNAGVEPATALQYFNVGKQRIRAVSSTLWLIEDFFVYQYGKQFNPKNRVHESIKKAYDSVGVNLGSIRGLIEVNLDPNVGVKDRVKDKDKDKDIDSLPNYLITVETDTREGFSTVPDGEKQFNQWWAAYGKAGPEVKCRHEWFAMTPQERQAALDTVKLYTDATETRYRCGPLKWLEEKRWTEYAGRLRMVRFRNALTGGEYGEMPEEQWNRIHANDPETPLKRIHE